MDHTPFGILRYMWQIPRPGSAYGAPWPDKAFEAIFNDRNGWSVGDYWQRCTFGLLRPVFRVFPWRILRAAEAEVSGDRATVVDLARRQAIDDGEILAGFAGVVAFVHAWPSDAGAIGRDARFDPGTDRLEFFQHEVGHMLGFEHAFGPGGAYADEYCVMGWTGPFEHSIAPAADLVDVPFAAGAAFWRSGRRPAAATLYRHLSSFASSAGVVRPPLGRDFSLTALSEAALGEPVIAVFPLPGGELSIEYRLDSGDDIAVRPALVVHSFGMQMNPPGQTEVRPPWFEAELAPALGSSQNVQGLTIGIAAFTPDKRTITVHVESSSSFIPMQSDWRWCDKCQGLFFGAGVTKSRCPAGDTHAPPEQSGSGNYSLPHNTPDAPNRQSQWRWCDKCQGLFFGAAVTKSRCPAGDTHAPPEQSGSGNYSLPHNTPDAPNRQSQWRWCDKCQGLFFGAAVTKSRCPAGDTHAPPEQSGSGNYSLPHTAA